MNYKRSSVLGVLLPLILMYLSCGEADSGEPTGRFHLLPGDQVGIDFVNQLTETESNNVLAYEYFYNGGGVAVGDVNNDGLPDLFFTGNMVPNRLYLNQGDLQFSDITETAGVGGRDGDWCTGANMVDINADGWLDLYVAYSGDVGPDRRRNELYINQGDATFREAAADYGLDISAYTTHSLFFDYDGDGDLDCYLLNHNIEEFQNFDATFVKKMTDPAAGDRLLRNDGGRFTDVSAEAGIRQNPLGFGLGIAASDLDADGDLDLYVSNDYTEEDYLYINQGDGTFREELKERIGHISNFSMGSDIADYNNDGRPDIFTLDMLPEDNRRQKLLYGPDEYEKYQSMLRNGFHHQLMRNMLQLNNGDGSFSEVGQLAGVSNTDWSWAALFADLDNDGWQDLFVSNGYLRDYTNRDFMAYYADQRIREVRGEPTAALMEIVAEMESTKTHNYVFRNQGDLTFSKMVDAWGFEQAQLTNGAAYADLDRDGDLDLILNNVNEVASIYENRVADGHYLQVRLEGSGQNRFGIGAKVAIHYDSAFAWREFIPTRGFQSAVHTPLHFGLQEHKKIDQLIVTWPDGRQQSLQDVAAGQILTLRQEEAVLPANAADPAPQPFFLPIPTPVDFVHQGTSAVDFKTQPLLPWMVSDQGPATAWADVNGDQRPDLYLGGARLQAGVLYLQQADGSFSRREQAAFAQDVIHDDVAAQFFDADGDGDQDLYVVSGGYHYLPKDLALQDRLYRNDGRGNFTRDKEALPALWFSGSCVASHDIDQDGDIDLFVGGRMVPGQYPQSPGSSLLLNDGSGHFQEATEGIAPDWRGLGLVTAAIWISGEEAGGAELITLGEWMPLRRWRYRDGKIQEEPLSVVDEQGQPITDTHGWWYAVHAADLDGDGDEDLVLGNLGDNHQMRVSPEEPATLYYADFDDNGTIDPILSYYIQGKAYSAFSRDELLGQLIELRKKFPDYTSYAAAELTQIISADRLDASPQRRAVLSSSIWLERRQGEPWVMHLLPPAAQFSPVYAVQSIDVNNDGRLDLILGGNKTRTRANWGPWDGSPAQLFLNLGAGDFQYVMPQHSGLGVRGDVRHINSYRQGDQVRILLSRYGQSVSAYALVAENSRLQ